MIDIPTQRLQTQRALEGSILWQAVPAVRQGRYARIDQFYPFGGLPSALMLAETIVERLQEFSR
jgi:iron complex transport system substrate-binding protein